MKRYYIVLLFLHAALAVLAGQLRLPRDNILSCSTDYFTGYIYDRNANITSLTRMGVGVTSFDEEDYARSLAAMMDEYPHKPSEKTAAWLGRFSDENVAAAWHKVFLKISK